MTPQILSGLFRRLIRSDSPESPKALVLYQSALGLLVIALILAASIATRIIKNQSVDTGAVTAFVTACGFLAGLAGFHRQSDPVPSQADTAGSSRGPASVDCADPSGPSGGGDK